MDDILFVNRGLPKTHSSRSTYILAAPKLTGRKARVSDSRQMERQQASTGRLSRESMMPSSQTREVQNSALDSISKRGRICAFSFYRGSRSGSVPSRWYFSSVMVTITRAACPPPITKRRALGQASYSPLSRARAKAAGLPRIPCRP